MPEYRKSSALTEVSSVSELYKLAKRLEDADCLGINASCSDNRMSFNSSSNHHNKKNSIPTDFSRDSRGTFPRKVSTIDKKDEVFEKSVPNTCWNCHKPGHVYSQCKQNIVRKFCFRCGLRDATTVTCTRCNKRKN